jgi:hypothetical protein
LVERVRQANDRRATDLNHLEGLMSRLTGAGYHHDLAAQQLRVYGSRAIPGMLQIYGQRRVEVSANSFSMVCSTFEPAVVDQLIGALRSPSESVRTVSIQTLGKMRDVRAIPYLWRHAFGREATSEERSVSQDALKQLANVSRDRKLRIDLATAINPEAKIKIIGIRQGEKIHEDLITISDSISTYDLGKYYVILNYYSELIIKNYSLKNIKKVPDSFCYNSGSNPDYLDVNQLKERLNNII